MGTVGPGSIHLLNGLYDAKKSHAPVLALCGQVPLAELGTDFFQEVDNDALFADVAVFRHTVASPEQLPGMLERAVQSALTERGVAVLTLPGDVGGLDLPKGTPEARFIAPPAKVVPDRPRCATAADADRRGRARSRCSSGSGAREARDEVLALAEQLAAPMVLTLKAKEGLERENPFQVGQTGLIGNPAARHALDGVRPAADARHRLPVHGLVSGGQGRGAGGRARRAHRPPHAGRRAASWATPGSTARGAARQRRAPRPDRDHLEDAAGRYARLARRAAQARRPGLRRRAG